MGPWDYNALTSTYTIPKQSHTNPKRHSSPYLTERSRLKGKAPPSIRRPLETSPPGRVETRDRDKNKARDTTTVPALHTRDTHN